MRPKLTQQRKPVDLAFLKSLTVDATEIEKEIVRIFAKDDDYLADFEFTPIHIAVLDLYDASDSERPKLEDLIEFVDNANNAPPGTNWARWKTRYQKTITVVCCDHRAVPRVHAGTQQHPQSDP
jgi:hypothetical protein